MAVMVFKCHSELQNCCQTAEILTGSWSFPDGGEVGGNIFQS